MANSIKNNKNKLNARFLNARKQSRVKPLNIVLGRSVVNTTYTYDFKEALNLF